MSAGGYTPGPWKAHETGLARSGKPEFEIHWSDIGECVAEIVHGDADARLIAAAPDLLAMVIRYRNETPLGHQPHMIAHLADELIAKATGGQS